MTPGLTRSFPRRAPLSAGSRSGPTPVQVWIIGSEPSRELDLDACWERLGRPEQARALAIVDEAERARFIRAHGSLRLLLGRQLGQEPGRLPLACAEGTPPRLMIDSPPIHCSLAHSGEYVVCAAAEVPVGVDVERLRGIPPTDALVRRECTEPERRRLSAADPADRERLFVRAWTRKEALSKAVGHGHGLSFAALESGARRTWVKDTRLSLFDLDLPAPYWGALAVGGRRPRLEIRR